MVITREDFDSYWNTRGKYSKLKNAERLHKSLVEKIDKSNETAELDEYVCGLRTGKESVRSIVVDFYEYLGEKRCKPESVLYDKVFYDYPFERQLEIAKFLHELRTGAEIEEKFGIDSRTRRDDLKALEDGITVLGSTIKIEREKIGRRFYYRTTLHPVFLPLNLTEVYALTVYLERAIKDHNPNAQIIRDISQRIKSQLSDYAYERLFPDEVRYEAKNAYINDEAVARQRKGIYMYLMKSGQMCKFIFNGVEHTGTIIWSGSEYRVQLENGEQLDADISEVDFIIDTLSYR